PAHGEITDRHDATRQRPGFQEPASVEPFAGSEQSTVAAARDRQHAGRSRPEAFLPAANEALAGFHVLAPGRRERSTSSSASRTAPSRDPITPDPATPH